MKCLWLSRILPFPQTAGDRIYSLNLAKSLARAGAEVTFVGFAGDEPPESISDISWRIVPGQPRNEVASLASTMPYIAARHATASYKETISQLGRSDWDVVLLDHCGMGWVIKYRHLFGSRPPRFVFVSHNHEETVTRIQASGKGTSLSQWDYLTQMRGKKAAVPMWLYLMQNHLKMRFFERSVARACDLTTTITGIDLEDFQMVVPGLCGIILPPGYDGKRVQQRHITKDTPRTVLVLGSYRWWAKQLNLKMLLHEAAPVMAVLGIDLHVVGDMPDDFLSAMKQRYPTVRFSGYVEDLSECITNSRLAIIAEPIGGGFKMKLLEYVFNRMPVAVLDTCVAGIPVDVRINMLIMPSLESLVLAAGRMVDDVGRLDQMQRDAYAAAESKFDWSDCGRTLMAHLKSRLDLKVRTDAALDNHSQLQL